MLFFIVIISLVSTILIISQTIPPKRSQLIDTDYFKLKESFLSAVSKSSGTVQNYPISARGPANEGLSIDVAWFGSKSPDNVILHISGTHGVEGFAGSTIQTTIINRGIKLKDNNSAIIFIHALNPWGMAHYRRVNESNVDLNRNFILNSDNYKGSPEGYKLIYKLLNPSGSPFRIDLFYPSAIYNILRYGFVTLKQAIAHGQYEYPKGIYYGGNKLEESLQILNSFINKNLQTVKKLTVIEVHSGLGEWAKDVVFSSISPESEEGLLYQSILNEKFTNDVADQGPGYRTSGDLLNEIPKLLPNTKILWLLQEFGAYNPVKTLRALRDENRYFHSDGRELTHWSKKTLLETFTPGDDKWQEKVIKRGVELFEKVEISF